MSALTAFNIVLEVLAGAIREENKAYQLERKKYNSICRDHVIVSMKIPKWETEYTKGQEQITSKNNLDPHPLQQPVQEGRPQLL